MRRDVLTTYLEMRRRDQLVRAAKTGLEVREANAPCPELNRFLYTAIGGDWYWIDRLSWSYGRWLDYLREPAVRTWIGLVGGNPVGYFELDARAGEDVEIAYFGLLPRFQGRGFGGHLLTCAVEEAWGMTGDGGRVWVHTCTLDAPSALPNYERRGFRRYKTETAVQELPAGPPGPWPSAREVVANDLHL
jgi:GNAT superfamily N-acetyltransferase